MASTSKRSPVPLFALPDLVVFPGFPQPLHIFEPRYRQMMEDLLDRGGQLAIGTVLGEDRDQLAGDAPIQPLGCVGSVEHYERLDDGRFNIVFRGIARALLSESPSDRLYRVVAAEPLMDVLSGEEDEERYRRRVRRALEETSLGRSGSVLERLDLTQLTDLLIFQLKLPPESSYALYALRPVSDRIEAALEEYQRATTGRPDGAGGSE